MEKLNDKQLYEQARKRVEFRRHFVVYFVINSMLWLIWYLTGSNYPWPIWPAAGWGIGLIFHYLFEYRSSKFFSEEQEFKKLKREMGEHQSVND